MQNDQATICHKCDTEYPLGEHVCDWCGKPTELLHPEKFESWVQEQIIKQQDR